MIGSLLQVGSFLLTWWWVAAILLALAAAGGFLKFGAAFLDVLKGVVAFVRTPVGQLMAFGAVVYLAASFGYGQAQDVCDAGKLRAALKAEQDAHAATRRAAAAAQESRERDALQSAFDRLQETADRDAIHATPQDTAVALSRAAARRLRGVGR